METQVIRNARRQVEEVLLFQVQHWCKAAPERFRLVVSEGGVVYLQRGGPRWRDAAPMLNEVARAVYLAMEERIEEACENAVISEREADH